MEQAFVSFPFTNNPWTKSFSTDKGFGKNCSPLCKKSIRTLRSPMVSQTAALLKSLENSLEWIFKTDKTCRQLEPENCSVTEEKKEFIQCSACKAFYSVDGSMFGEKGRYVRCIVCGSVWLQLPHDIKTVDENMEARELSCEDWEKWKLVRQRKLYLSPK